MPRSLPLCLDASCVMRRLTEPDDETLERLWNGWLAAGYAFVAPGLLRYEVTNALHRLRRAGTIGDATAHTQLAAALALPIQYYEDDLHDGALRFARRFSLPAAYDAHYLALAERLGCEFWTADQRLANSVRPALSWVHLAGE